MNNSIKKRVQLGYFSTCALKSRNGSDYFSILCFTITLGNNIKKKEGK